MIIGRNFAWTHIPRTGGDLVSTIIKDNYSKYILYADENTHAKHDAFSNRMLPFNDANFHFLLNIRRLPDFILSWIVMCSGRLRSKEKYAWSYPGVWPYYKELPPPSKEQLLDIYAVYGDEIFQIIYGSNFASLPDRYLMQFTNNNTLNVKYIRLEEALSDLEKHMNMIVNNNINITSISPPKKPFNYEKDISSFFSKSELVKLYSNNPFWSEVEASIYGGVL